MTLRHIHMGIDVKGFVRNAQAHRGKKGWLSLGAHDDKGRVLTADEVKAEFLSHVAEGHKVIPMGPCPTWDYQTGCPGHLPLPDPQGLDLECPDVVAFANSLVWGKSNSALHVGVVREEFVKEHLQSCSQCRTFNAYGEAIRGTAIHEIMQDPVSEPAPKESL
jgi:hypothetical protein